MTDAGFFKGTSADQDSRFVDKNKKLMKTMKFADNIDRKLDMAKVNMESIKPWIARRVTELLGYEDDVVIDFVVNQLDDVKLPDGRKMQMNLTGFLNAKNSRVFVQELWALMLSAMENIGGIPAVFVELKKEEIKVRQAEQEQLKETVRLQEIMIRETLAKQRVAAAESARDSAAARPAARRKNRFHQSPPSRKSRSPLASATQPSALAAGATGPPRGLNGAPNATTIAKIAEKQPRHRSRSHGYRSRSKGQRSRSRSGRRSSSRSYRRSRSHRRSQSRRSRSRRSRSRSYSRSRRSSSRSYRRSRSRRSRSKSTRRSRSRSESPMRRSFGRNCRDVTPKPPPRSTNFTGGGRGRREGERVPAGLGGERRVGSRDRGVGSKDYRDGDRGYDRGGSRERRGGSREGVRDRRGAPEVKPKERIDGNDGRSPLSYRRSRRSASRPSPDSLSPERAKVNRTRGSPLPQRRQYRSGGGGGAEGLSSEGSGDEHGGRAKKSPPRRRDTPLRRRQGASPAHLARAGRDRASNSPPHRQAPAKYHDYSPTLDRPIAGQRRSPALGSFSEAAARFNRDWSSGGRAADNGRYATSPGRERHGGGLGGPANPPSITSPGVQRKSGRSPGSPRRQGGRSPPFLVRGGREELRGGGGGPQNSDRGEKSTTRMQSPTQKFFKGDAPPRRGYEGSPNRRRADSPAEYRGERSRGGDISRGGGKISRIRGEIPNMRGGNENPNDADWSREKKRKQYESPPHRGGSGDSRAASGEGSEEVENEGEEEVDEDERPAKRRRKEEGDGSEAEESDQDSDDAPKKKKKKKDKKAKKKKKKKKHKKHKKHRAEESGEDEDEVEEEEEGGEAAEDDREKSADGGDGDEFERRGYRDSDRRSPDVDRRGGGSPGGGVGGGRSLLDELEQKMRQKALRSLQEMKFVSSNQRL